MEYTPLTLEEIANLRTMLKSRDSTIVSMGLDILLDRDYYKEEHIEPLYKLLYDPYVYSNIGIRDVQTYDGYHGYGMLGNKLANARGQMDKRFDIVEAIDILSKITR